jgi:hypothetical protein
MRSSSILVFAVFSVAVVSLLSSCLAAELAAASPSSHVSRLEAIPPLVKESDSRDGSKTGDAMRRPIDLIGNLLMMEGLTAGEMTAEDESLLIAAADSFDRQHSDRMRHGDRNTADAAHSRRHATALSCCH